MSNKPISMTQVSLIEQLKGQGFSIRSISRKTGLHRNTVARYVSDLFVSVDSEKEKSRVMQFLRLFNEKSLQFV